MNFQIDHSIPCDTTTVTIWACKEHAMYLCDEHVKRFQFFCPFTNCHFAHIHLTEQASAEAPSNHCLYCVSEGYFVPSDVR